MFAKTSIRLRLIWTMALLGLLIVITGASGLYGMAHMNEAMREVSSNDMPSAMAIAKSQQGLSRARLVADRVLMHPEAQDALKTLQRAENFLNESDKAWAAYLALPQDAEEHRLAAVVDTDRSKFINEGFKPLLKALSDGDNSRADQITMTQLPPLFSKFSDSTTALDQFQSRSSAEFYKANQADYRKQQWTAAIVIGFSVLVIGFACFSLLRSILKPIRIAIDHFNRIAEGNLSSHIKVDGGDEMAMLMKGIASMQVRLAQTVRSVRDGTAGIATATNEIAIGNLDLSRRTEQQAASLEETASSLEQLTASVKQNSDNTRKSNQLAEAASATAVKGGAIVSEVVTTMNSIREASAKIEDIIGLIDGIAFQTNILALNAAVEAARAGEQGRGFAVVASEVRNLAHRSKAAAQEVKTLIADSANKVNNGSKLVNEAGATMKEIASSIGSFSGIIVEISDAGQEQELGIGQINQAVSALDDMTQQNAALVEQAAAASESLNEQAAALAEVVAAFSLDHAQENAGKAPGQRRPAGQSRTTRRLAQTA